MAIQIPNPGTGNGASGDNEFVLWSKVKDNFTDQTNAASKLVGAADGRVPLAENVREALLNMAANSASVVTLKYLGETLSPDNFLPGKVYYKDLHPDDVAGYPKAAEVKDTKFVFETTVLLNAKTQTGYGYATNEVIRRTKPYNQPWTGWVRYWTSSNATRDSNGFLKASSPVLRVFSDHIEGNDDGEKLGATFIKNGIGDYLIKGTTGLSTDGWYIELPKDMNGNPKVAVTLSEVDGVISLKTYKRIFSMETFTFEPDLDNPLDIPDGRWIDLRLNEIPVENEDNVQTEV